MRSAAIGLRVRAGAAGLRWIGEILIVGAMAAASSSAADRAADAQPSSPRSVLAGTRWHLESIRSNADGQAPIHPKDTSAYSLTFNPDGSAAFKLNCNRGQGTWRASPGDGGSAGTLAFGPIATTRMLCPPPTLDGRIARDMADVRSYLLRDGHLYLSLTADGGIYEWAPD